MSGEAVAAPEDPPTLLPGRSARDWLRIAIGCMLASVPMVVLIGLGAGLPQPFKDIVMFGSLFVIFGLSAVGGRAGVKSNSVGLRERDAGYTTLYGMFPRLWQLDPRTGEVLRRPGERRVRRRSPEDL